MKWFKAATLAGLTLGLTLGSVVDLKAQEDNNNGFNKFYGGLTVGTDKTTFTVEGGDTSDKALIYGVVAGKNFTVAKSLFLGIEAGFHFNKNIASGPVSTTFPPSMPFTTFGVERTRSYSLNAKAGFKVKGVVLYGLVGITNSRLKLTVDNTPIATFFGRGKSSTGNWGLTFGVGLEVLIPKTPVHIRGEWRRTLLFSEISAEDFGLTDADFGLNNLNVSYVTSEFRGAVIISF